MTQPPTRRSVLAVGASVAAAPALAACGDPGEDPHFQQIDPPGAGAHLALTRDIPVGGCQVFAPKGTVITQPREGEFHAFGAECSHKGCFVSSSTEGHIPCRCHGSQFDLTSGAVLNGPARDALEEFSIDVADGKIVMA
ncbi:ubiquinol-cytochrome c reductase iron-sulfur subunit [Nocardioides gilvus]|uniref:QcrA and Rieske domain-containing protein n=1 Tax=Nocardioides gilvus TaxID=1735589 RepID=UPI000D741869|nr:Rieske (2Fe-2S) protein [Nocardioides gilvus]